MDEQVQSADARKFRSVMGKFATGVSIVGYWADGQPAGLTANAFVSVSLDPPLILVSLRRQSRFLTSVSLGDRYGISFLADDQQSVSDRFAGGPSADRSMLDARGPAPIVPECLAAIVARVVDIHPAGDHMLVIGEVEQLQERQVGPLVYFQGRYRRLVARGDASLKRPAVASPRSTALC